MKKHLILFVVCCSFFTAQGANPDSLALVQAKWMRDTIAPGVVLQQVHFNQKNLFSSNQYLCLVEIAPSAPVKFALSATPLLTTTGELAAKKNAIAAINGSFFKFNYEYNDVDYNSTDYLRMDGRRLADNTYTAKGQRQVHQEAAVAMFNGNLYIVKATTEKGWESYICSQDVLTSGPLLAIAGRPEPLKTTSFYTTRHPRTAVAKRADGTVLLFTVDGRNAQSEGMTLEELQKTLLWLCATDIINFDGGGSTTMYVQGKNEQGVINHPCDNQLFDHIGSRKVANALCIMW